MAKENQTEKRRKQKGDCERRRREKIKGNSDLYEQAKKEEHKRYNRRKEEGKLRSISEVSKRAARAIRRKWKECSVRYRAKRQINPLQLLLASDIPSTSQDTNQLSRKACGRKRILKNRSRTHRKLEKFKQELERIRKKKLKYKQRYYRLKAECIKNKKKQT